MKQKTYDVIVVGGGAAGLMAAIHAASGGAHTAILDHHEVSGKKILATGNGKCNFTNLMQGESYYRCDTPAFVLHILEQFSAEDTIAFFRELGVMTRDRQGYCYPRSGQASAIRNALLRKAEKLGIEIHNGIGIRKIIRENNRFSFDTKSGSFFSTCCILATGGMASPKSGSDGSGYIYAKSFGHTVKKPLPALTALMAEANWLKETTGVRADATVKLYVDGSCVAEDTGEVQMADYGISGIPAFQVSRYAAVALDRKQCVTATLDFVPEYTEEQLRDFLKQQLDVASAEESWKMLLSGIVNEKIASMLCAQKHLGERKIASIPKAKNRQLLREFANLLKQVKFPITGVRGFQIAQVTCGGIPVTELTKQMESERVEGLYFAGEIVDVDGMCGGYNLQWAWSGGAVAGTAAAEKSVRRKRTDAK